VAQKPSSVAAGRPTGLKERLIPSSALVRYLYQPDKLEGGRRRATDPVRSLTTHIVRNAVRQIIRDWQAHHRHHGGHQGNNIPFPTFIHCSSKGKCGLLPQHYGHRMKRRCNHLILLSLIFRPAALCWWAPKNNNNNIYGGVDCNSC